ncbi:MAG: hypothetical protein AB1543_03260 [Candidatus Bipolaricaulota bacterium]
MWRLVIVGVLLAVAIVGGAAGSPGLGVGMQFTIPTVFGVSVRYWTTDTLGLEGTAFLFSADENLWGVAGARGLVRLAQADLAGLYLALGGAYYFPERVPAASLCGGIDLALPFARSLSVNVEFGFLWHRDAGFGMAFGTGIHFYFDR